MVQRQEETVKCLFVFKLFGWPLSLSGQIYLSLSVFESSILKHIYLKSYHNFTLNIYFYATMRANPQAKYDERNEI